MKNKEFIALAIVIFATAGLSAIIFRFAFQARPNKGDSCMSKLALFSKEFDMYAKDHGGRYPDSWQAIYDYIASDSEHIKHKLFVCRGAAQQAGPTNNVDSWCSFVIVPGLTTNSSKNLPHAYCRIENHKGKGANVLFTDGSVYWLNKEEFCKITKKELP